MNFRKLKQTNKLGQIEVAEELPKAVTLEVYTKCPSKWLLIDLETGENYRGRDSSKENVFLHWKKINKIEINKNQLKLEL